MTARLNDDILAAEERFFTSLVNADGAALAQVTDETFLLVDVVGGTVIDRPAFLAAVATGQVAFDHVQQGEIYICNGHDWQLVSAQGTPIADNTDT